MKQEKTDKEKLDYIYQHAIYSKVVDMIMGILIVLIFLKLYFPN